MLVHKAADIVDFVMYNHVQVLLGRVLGNVGESEFLGHFGGRTVRRQSVAVRSEVG